MPLQPNVLERQLIRAGLIPGILLDVGLTSFTFWAMIAAMELGLFEAVAEEPQRPNALAERFSADADRLTLLLDVLVELGYVEEHEEGLYQLTKAARRTMPLGELPKMASFFKAQLLSYVDAARAVCEDPEGGLAGWDLVQSGEVGRGYQATMRWLAAGTVDEVAKKVDVPDTARRLLDVGGSHGLYTVAFLRRYRHLQGTVLDWPIGIEEAKRTLDEHSDLADRVELVERDFMEEELPGDFDVVFLGNIIHSNTPAQNRALFQKIARATNEGALVVILDQFAGVKGSRFARASAALIGWNLFLFSGGRAYAFDEVVNWLEEAGFQRAVHKGLRQPGFSLAIAQKMQPNAA
ncbi:MAG: methyltransferase [Rubricoccaceae bacterium]|nr:methyltransferase [Rubricoccaceae bacterium]